MLSPRWRKVARDLANNKSRALLVMLSIAVGVFAIGTIAGARAILSTGMQESYRNVHPAAAMLYTIDPFDEGVLDAVRSLDEVDAAEGRYILSVRLQTGADEWRNLQLFALADYADIRIHTVQPVTGAWPPPPHSLLIERDTLNFIDAAVGDTWQIETPSGKIRSLPVAGVAHEMPIFPSRLAGIAYGYITFDTLAWLGVPYSFNEVLFVAHDQSTPASVQVAINRVQDRLEENGIRLRGMFVPITPNRHDGQDIIDALLVVLGVLGLLVLFLSGFLVVNTMAALLAQQTRQIGVMKTIGARPHQLIAMYLSMTLVFGVAATVLALPFSNLAARALAQFALDQINFTVADFSIPSSVYTLQAGVGLLSPLLAALYPVLAGTRISVRAAIVPTVDSGSQSVRLIDRCIQALPAALVRRISRPLLLSLRNTFRRPGRIALTLSTLALGSAIFIAVFSVRASTVRTFTEAARYWQYDVEVTLARPLRLDRIARTALQVPGVAAVESWGLYNTRRVRADGSESSAVLMLAPPTASALLDPILVQGRWLLPADENAIVIDTDLLKREPEIKLGDSIRFKIGGRDVAWQVVGVVKGQFRGAPVVYVNYPYFSTHAVRQFERANRVVIVAEQSDPAYQSLVAGAVEQAFKQSGIDVSLTETVSEIRARVEEQFNIVIVFLVLMATMMAVVGGCGLAGTMSINVLERTREIGVMRAIGASNRAVGQIILGEGLVIGLLSWGIGALLAWPLSQFLSNAVGIAMAKAALSYTFSPLGLFVWLVAVIILSAVATFLPAWSAARLTVREVLASE